MCVNKSQKKKKKNRKKTKEECVQSEHICVKCNYTASDQVGKNRERAYP